MENLGFIRAAAVSPVLRTGNVSYNTDEIIRCAKEADLKNAGIIAFPELSTTGTGCGDLFFQEHLYKQNLEGLKKIIKASYSISASLVVGCYIRIENSFFNCAAVIHKGNLKGLVPAMYSENRCFADGIGMFDSDYYIYLFDEEVRVGNLIFLDDESELAFGVVTGNDIKAPISPAAEICLKGAHIIVNISHEAATVKNSENSINLFKYQSQINSCGMIYASSGICESTTDMVCNGQCLISEYGKLISEGETFSRKSNIIYGDIDFDTLRFRRSVSNFYLKNSIHSSDFTVNVTPLTFLPVSEKLLRNIRKNPFVPDDKNSLNQRCKEIFNIQTAALARRIEHTHADKVTIGISGGLDSTLALLVCVNAMKVLGKSSKDVVAITMPGFGTSDHTHDNAWIIMEKLGVDAREIPIGKAVDLHFNDIGHNPDLHDLTYENSQARERTQILMDVSGDEGGFVVGTGDLSELALGWCTYNGDHMSMYGVNADIPKTLVRLVVGWFADNLVDKISYGKDAPELKKALHDIMETPISPELLPPASDGSISQKTEERVGPYELNEFFLYYTVSCGMRPAKLYRIACSAFSDEYSNSTVKKWLYEFYRRFFSQQFKRNCIPDGPKIGSVSLSPRGSWIMPSDADAATWLEEVTAL